VIEAAFPPAVDRNDAPLVLSIPHAGTSLPDEIAPDLVSPWLARKDADWYVAELYDFASSLGATIVRTAWSRTVIDVNRNPDGASLYPGMATTGLCPVTTFDGEPLYREGAEPDAAAIAARRRRYHEPYHAVLRAELARLRERHERVVLYDAHSIRSRVSMLFDGELPVFNIGSYDGRSCAVALTQSIHSICASSGQPAVVDGRFKGGYVTRHYGEPARGVHAVQMELACRAYLDEPPQICERSWPPPYDRERAAAVRATLRRVLETCLEFAVAEVAAQGDE
jgi:formiminoglutamase